MRRPEIINPSHWVALALIVLLPFAARGIDGALDDVPAGVLLLPYFEVDLGDPNGPDTLFSLHNNSAGPVLADVVLGTDWGLQTLQFTVFLGPFAVQEIRLRDVFTGAFPNIDATPGCPTLGPIDSDEIEAAIAAHRGEATALYSGQCAAQDLGDDLLRGFGIAVFPSQCSAFGAEPAATQGFNPANSNLLWGDYTLIEREAGVAVGELLPALELAPVLTAASSGSNGTSPFLPIVFAESLPGIWGVPLALADGATTEVIAFNIPRQLTPQGVPCGSTPTWYPQGQNELTAYDVDGDSVSLDSFRPFPAVTNRVTAGPIGFPVPFDQGWLRVDFTSSPVFFSPAALSGRPDDTVFSYVAALQRDDGRAGLRRGIALPESLEP